jgi:hypothetical protein
MLKIHPINKPTTMHMSGDSDAAHLQRMATQRARSEGMLCTEE